ALWCTATEDAVESLQLAKELLTSKSAEMRFVAARHLVNLETGAAGVAVAPALDDEDLRVAVLAVAQVWNANDASDGEAADNDHRFERLERLILRVPEKPQKLKPIVWPWNEREFSRTHVAASLLQTRGKRHATRLIPHLPSMDPSQRRSAAAALVA